jgi:hypothetical protein
VQTLEDSICAMLLLCFIRHQSLLQTLLVAGRRELLKGALYAPEPTQDIHGENGNARSGSNAG